MVTLKRITTTWKYLEKLSKIFHWYAKEERFRKSDETLKHIIRVYKEYKQQVREYRE